MGVVGMGELLGQSVEDGTVGDGGWGIGDWEELRNLCKTVLPDGPATRGAATSLRAEAFGWALPLVAITLSLPTDGRTSRSLKKACERPCERPLHA